jgi:MFS family permease
MKKRLPEVDTPHRTENLVLGFKRNVLVLSLTSFLTDASNTIIFPLMALFLDNVLGVKTSLIGLVEGVVECAASLLKMLSGWLSDRLRERKRLIAGGYWFSTVAKAFLAIAGSWWFVLLIRFVDRVGKGLRAAPAQALVADASREGQVGRTFGFYKMMDVGGGMMGLLAAGGIIFLAQGGRLLLARRTYQMLVAAAMVPALFGALLVTLFIKGRGRPCSASAPLPSLGWQRLSVRFKAFLVIIFVFALGNSSDAFLTLRAQNVGASTLHVVLLLVVFRAIYSLVAWPAGALSDRLGRKRVLVGGWILYALVYVGFALARSAWHVWGLYMLYGLYHGVTKGVERAFVADLVPAPGQRGAAYGTYSAILGLAALPASVIAGIVWQAFTPAASFLLGAALALLAVLLLALWMK